MKTSIVFMKSKIYGIHLRKIYVNRFKNCYLIGFNGRIEYSITAGDENNDFEILPNGTIRTQHQLDRETVAAYNLVVIARDSAKEPEKRLSSTVQVYTYKYL